jgi:hypothetical protein
MRHHQGNLHGKDVTEYQDINSKMWRDAMHNLQCITKKELQEINNKFKKEKEIKDKKNLKVKREKYNEKRRMKRQAERIKEKESPLMKKVKKNSVIDLTDDIIHSPIDDDSDDFM